MARYCRTLCGTLFSRQDFRTVLSRGHLSLLVIFREQTESQSQSSSSRRGIAAYSVFIAAGLLAFVLVLFKTVASANPAYVAHFILPGVSVALYLLWSEFNDSQGPEVKIAAFDVLYWSPLARTGRHSWFPSSLF